MKDDQRNHKGSISEKAAIVWLMKNKFSVFENTSIKGPIDLVAMRDGETILIDVKSKEPYRKVNGTYSVSETKLKTPQVKLGVKALYVLPDGSCFWSAVDAEQYLNRPV